MDRQNRRGSESDYVKSTPPLRANLWRETRLTLWLSVLLALGVAVWVAAQPVAGKDRQQGSVVEVSLVDGAIEMPDTLPAGATTFEITNNGTTQHSFRIGGPAVELELESNLEPGQSGTLDVELAPGTYEVICPVGNHAAHGMRLTLTVTGAEAAGLTPTVVEEEAGMTPTAVEEEATAPAEEEATAPAEEETTAPAEEEAAPAAAEEEATPTAVEEEAATPAAAEEEATPAAEEEAEAAPAPGEEGETEATGEVAQLGESLPGNPSIQLVKVADGLADPINVAAPPDGSGRVFVVERVGRIRIIQDGELLEQPFLDIKDVVKRDFLEQGLLGLAFHPDYATNGRFFVYYTDWQTNGDVFLVEYHVSDDPNVADPDSAKVLLSHDHPFVNHNGGTLHFGPDGYLYLSIGDGGLAGDPYRNAQNLSTLLGKVIRIDVNVGEDEEIPYRIPPDNPFSGRVMASANAEEQAQTGQYLPAARPEIYAYGLRNPWQFSFDSETGDLYIADVGQNRWEEINFQPAGSVGGWDYGWPINEGSHCYPEDAQCRVFGVPPVAEYEHVEDYCTVVGIGVYRGAVSTSLNGIYFNADYCAGQFWGLVRDENDTWQFAELLDTDLQISGAGMDEAGELYVTSCACDYDREYDADENPSGAVWRIVATDQVPADAETAPEQEAGEEEGGDEEAAAGGSGEVVHVSLIDGHIDMPDTLPAGPTTFEVSNDGTMDHNFEIEGGDIEQEFEENLAPGDTQTMEVDLPAGEYRVYCPVADHAQQGMELTLTVQ